MASAHFSANSVSLSDISDTAKTIFSTFLKVNETQTADFVCCRLCTSNVYLWYVCIWRHII